MPNVLLMPKLSPGRPEYREMAEIALRSYRIQLQGEWEQRFCEHGDWQELWKLMFATIRDLCKAGFNVFTAGADTMAVKPVDIFGKSDKMLMFWHTDPSSLGDKYPQYLNAELMYFPASLPERIWEIGERGFAEIDAKVYDASQRVFNDMFWGQDNPPDPDPSMNWSKPVSNPLPSSEAKIWHYHGSRGPDDALRMMRAGQI